MASTLELLLMSQMNFQIYKPVAILYQSTVQSLANNVAAPLGFDQFVVDSWSGHSTTVNNSRYTAPVAGYYIVKGQGVFAPSATGDRSVQLYKNGVAIPYAWHITPSSGAAFAPGRETWGLVPMAVGDYVESWAAQTSGAALNTFSGSTACSAMYVGWYRPYP